MCEGGRCAILAIAVGEHFDEPRAGMTSRSRRTPDSQGDELLVLAIRLDFFHDLPCVEPLGDFESGVSVGELSICAGAL